MWSPCEETIGFTLKPAPAFQEHQQLQHLRASTSPVFLEAIKCNAYLDPPKTNKHIHTSMYNVYTNF